MLRRLTPIERKAATCARSAVPGLASLVTSAPGRTLNAVRQASSTRARCAGGRPVGDAPDDDRRAVRLHSCQALTPETATSTHYFFQQAHRADAGDAAITRGIHEQLLVAFEEDRRMITAQHRNLAADAAAHMQVLWMDAALVQFRRLKERMAREEARGGVGEVSG
mgnify:CR=1 FL=1